MPRPVHLLLTSVGGRRVPGVIAMLRQQPEFDLTITGVDAVSGGAAADLVDEFIHVPRADAHEYTDVMLDVCRSHDVDVVVPQSDPEAVRLAKVAPAFASAGCVILGSAAETSRIAVNKYECLCRLRDHGVDVPRFHRPRTLDDLETALADLGFPRSMVVFKPVASSGSRGFRLIAPEFDELGEILSSRTEIRLAVPRLRDLLQRAETFPDFLLMEHLGGASFSVDVLVRHGRAARVIPQRRVSPVYGPADVTRFEADPTIDRVVQEVLAAMPFRFLVNIDMAYRRAPREGGVLPFDVNPRPSALIAAPGAAGRFLLAEAIADALGVEAST